MTCSCDFYVNVFDVYISSMKLLNILGTNLTIFVFDLQFVDGEA